MRIFAVSDLHLSLTAPYLPTDTGAPPLAKPMDVFGPLWQDSFSRLFADWQAQVAADDAVLIPGDISWAMTVSEARHDLAFLAALPGRKLICKGNHDYWWASLSQVRAACGASVTVLQHSAARLGEFAVAGTRGWLIPSTREFRESDDRRLFERERLRLDMALREAQALGGPIIALLHYPPLPPEGGAGFSDLLTAYGVQLCLYGHIHGAHNAAFSGEYQGVDYLNVSMDRQGFALRRIV